MNAETIRSWRPSRFADVVGEKNRRTIRRLQRQVLEGNLASPMLLVSPYGFGKTSLVRLLLLALNCRQRDPTTADPCLNCDQCQCSGPRYNGFGHPFRRVEVDCTHLDRPELVELCREFLHDRDVALFLDEPPSSRGCPLAGSAPQVRGRFSRSIHRLGDAGSSRRSDPAVAGTGADGLARTSSRGGDGRVFPGQVQWGVATRGAEHLVRLMVKRSNRSFRMCLRVLGAAAENDGRILDLDTLEEFLAQD